MSPTYLRIFSQPQDLVSVPDLGSGHDIRCRVAGPLVVANTGVGLLVQTTGDLDQRTGVAASGTIDLELQALNVELSLVDMALVEADMLHTHEVLARRCLGRDGELHPVLLPRAPVSVLGSIALAETRLPHLEPVARSVVGGDGAGGLGHVEEARAGVLDELVVEELEPDLVAGVDLVGPDVAGGLGPDVATEVLLVDDVGEGGVVRVGVFADVRVLATLLLAVDEEDVEDVVGIDRGGRGGQDREDGERLHDLGGKGSGM